MKSIIPLSTWKKRENNEFQRWNVPLCYFLRKSNLHLRSRETMSTKKYNGNVFSIANDKIPCGFKWNWPPKRAEKATKTTENFPLPLRPFPIGSFNFFSVFYGLLHVSIAVRRTSNNTILSVVLWVDIVAGLDDQFGWYAPIVHTTIQSIVTSCLRALMFSFSADRPFAASSHIPKHKNSSTHETNSVDIIVVVIVVVICRCHNIWSSQSNRPEHCGACRSRNARRSDEKWNFGRTSFGRSTLRFRTSDVIAITERIRSS